jgi:CheY-like chemotaxis protein
MESVKRVTLIDDDPICHLISSRMIRQFSDLEVETYTDPREALFQLRWRAQHEVTIFPDIILLDIDMPYLNGWQFLEEFQRLPEEATKKTDVIILSSSSHHKDIEHSRMFKCVKDYFTKPMSEEKVRILSQLKVNQS